MKAVFIPTQRDFRNEISPEFTEQWVNLRLNPSTGSRTILLSRNCDSVAKRGSICRSFFSCLGSLAVPQDVTKESRKVRKHKVKRGIRKLKVASAKSARRIKKLPTFANFLHVHELVSCFYARFLTVPPHLALEGESKKKPRQNVESQRWKQ